MRKRTEFSSMIELINGIANDYFKYYPNSGLNYAIANRGSLLHQEALGFADVQLGIAMGTENKFRLGSISKIYTAAIAFQLIAQNKLKLSNRIVDIMGRSDDPKDKRVNIITIQNLLTHSSGIPNNSPASQILYGRVNPPSIADALAFLNEVELEFNPGAKVAYSNSGFTLLGRAMEAATGKAFLTLIESHLGQTAPSLARTDPNLRDKKEPVYYHEEPTHERAVLGPSGLTPFIEARDSTGGLISTASSVALFISSLENYFGPIGIKMLLRRPEGRTSYIAPGCVVDLMNRRWFHLPWSLAGAQIAQYGFAAGSHGVFVRGPDGSTVVLLSNILTPYVDNRGNGLIKQFARALDRTNIS